MTRSHPWGFIDFRCGRHSDILRRIRHGLLLRGYTRKGARLQHNGVNARNRAGTVGFVLLGVLAAVAFALCWLEPLRTIYSAGDPIRGCFEVAEQPTGVIESTSVSAAWKLLPPTLECAWFLDSGLVTTSHTLTPVSFPLLVAVQVAFVVVWVWRRVRTMGKLRYNWCDRKRG